MLLTEKRLLLIGGKGGVGKTTTSSALALLATQRGKNVLLVSTDPAHSLSDAFNRSIGDKITRLAPNLDGLELDPDRQVTEHLAKVSAQLKRFTRPEMYNEIERQMRLTRHSPGAQEAAMLERMANVIELGLTDYDLVIFDTAPTGHTLRLLSLPEAMAAWTQGLLNANKRSEKLGEVLNHLTPKSGRDVSNPLADPSEHATAGMDERNTAITDTLLARQRGRPVFGRPAQPGKSPLGANRARFWPAAPLQSATASDRYSGAYCATTYGRLIGASWFIADFSLQIGYG
jgi:arsenite-transporting ATPase